MDNSLIKRQAAIDALSTPHGILYPIRTVEALPSAQPDTIPVDWIQKYADDWEDMSYAYENPILGMLEDWREEQDE